MNYHEGEKVNFGELNDSLGVVPTSLAGLLDRFELQHPVLTMSYAVGAGVAGGELLAYVRHGDSIDAAHGLSVQINGLQHETNQQAKAIIELKEQRDHLNTGGAELLGGYICGVLIYSGLRAALRTRFGWSQGVRRAPGSGPIPPNKHRFTSLSSDSIHQRKKRLADWQLTCSSDANKV